MINSNKQYEDLLSASKLNIQPRETLARFISINKYLDKEFGFEYFNLLLLTAENRCREGTEASMQDVLDGNYNFQGVFTKLAEDCNYQFQHITEQEAFEAFNLVGKFLHYNDLLISPFSEFYSPLSVMMSSPDATTLEEACESSSMNKEFAVDAVNYFNWTGAYTIAA